MKIHAYPPPRTTLDDDDDDLRGGDGKGRRKKAQSLAPKKNSFGSDLSTSDTMEFKEVEKKSRMWNCIQTRPGSVVMIWIYLECLLFQFDFEIN